METAILSQHLGEDRETRTIGIADLGLVGISSPLRFQLWYGVTGGHSQNSSALLATHYSRESSKFARPIRATYVLDTFR
jgi:hypothetical protein